MTTIKAQLSSFELETRYEAAADPVGKSHFHALWLLSSGYDVDEVAEILSFSPRWVRALIKRYNEGGAEALGDQRIHNGTRPTILTPEALAALKERIKTPPDDGGLWTGPKIARWFAKLHGLQSVHDQRGWDALIAIGYSIQQPRPRHPDAATEEDRAALKKNFRPRLPRRGASIRARPSKSGRWMNVANAVCKEMFELILADFAKSVGAGANKRIVLQIDNAGWHGPENLSVPDGIRLVFQPAHSPELQPAEHLWAFVDEPLANCCFATIESLDQAVSDRCVALVQQPDTIRDNTLFHWWPCQRAKK